MWNRLVLVGLVASALALAPPAEAGLITGGFSITSFVSTNVNPFVPVNAATGATVALGVATGLDFTTTGLKTPGVAGQYWVTTAGGDFAPLFHTYGNIMDLSWSAGPPTPLPGYANPPIYGFQTGLSGFVFDLLTVSATGQNASQIDLIGTGMFHLTGFTDTPGSFTFTAQSNSATISYSASEGAVPEPASMLLFGTGLVGLAGVIRRRVKK